MPPKYVGFLILIWAVAAIAGSFSTGTNLVADNTVTNPVQNIMYYSETLTHGDWGVLATPAAAWGFFTSILRIMFLDFPVFHEGPWVILRWVVLAPIIGTVVYGIVAAFSGIFQRTV